MGSKSCLTILAAILAIGACTASAAMISATGNYSHSWEGIGTIVAVDQFNPALGTLTGAQLVVDATMQGSVKVENDSALGGEMSVILNAVVESFVGNLSDMTSSNMLQQFGPVLVGPSDGNPGSGTDFNDFGFLSASDADQDLLSSFSSLIGTNTIDVLVASSGTLTVAGVPDSTVDVTDPIIFGTVTINYTFIPVPEPSALTLSAIALLGLLVRFRRHLS